MVSTTRRQVQNISVDLGARDVEARAGRLGRRPASQFPERVRGPVVEVREGRPVRCRVPRFRIHARYGWHRSPRRCGLRFAQAIHRGSVDVQGHLHGPLPRARVPGKQGPSPGERGGFRLRRDADARHIHAGGQDVRHEHRRDLGERRVDKGVASRLQLREPLCKRQQGGEVTENVAGVDYPGGRRCRKARVVAAEGLRLVPKRPGEVHKGHDTSEDARCANKARDGRNCGF
mmetsp:Transcript_39257/g.113463  ORF Transcript_39257/g.113463 Transcript_39257/m.113463 type:complete len:232 (-) Transcript_39257:877-1572(-)